LASPALSIRYADGSWPGMTRLCVALALPLWRFIPILLR